MNCRKAKNQISLLVDGCLDAKSQELLLQHINGCDKCRALYNDMQKAVSRISDLESVALPEGFENRMHFALKREATEKKKSKFLKYSLIAMPAAAAVFAVVLGVNFVLSGMNMKKSMPDTNTNMFAMDAADVEMPESAPEAKEGKGAELKSVMPQKEEGTKCEDSGNLSGSASLANSFEVVVKSPLLTDENSDKVRNSNYRDTAKAIVLSLGLDESSIVMSEDSKCMKVAIPVELYEDFMVAVQESNFIVEETKDDVLTHSFFEVTFLFQD